MNKKGFTLVELLAVIILLTIIMTIGVVSVSSIRYKVAERQYFNLATTIESAAEKYEEQTSVKKFFVQTLIDAGLVETNGEDERLLDPRNDEAINCKLITIDDDNHASLDKTLEPSPECDPSLLSDGAIRIEYCLASNPDCASKPLPSDTNYWFKEGVILTVNPAPSSGLTFDETTRYSWVNPLAPDEVYESKTLSINDDYVSDSYQVTVKHNGNTYVGIAPVKIDKVPPKVFDIVDTNPGSWKSTKRFTFKLSDGESGLKEYAFSNSNEVAPTSGWHKVPGTNTKEYEVKDSTGEYKFTETSGNTVYIWVRDNNGNTNKNLMEAGSTGGINVENIDVKVDNIGISANYRYPIYRREVILTGTASDSESGIIAYNFTTSSSVPSSWNYINGYNSSTQQGTLGQVNQNYTVTSNGTYYFHVKDAAGNTKTTSIIVNNIDRKVDYVYFYNTESAWVTSSPLRGTIKDNEAGVVAYSFTSSSSTPSSWNYLSGYNAYSTSGKKGDITVSGNATSYGTWYLHVKDAAGNTSKYSVYINNVGRKVTRTVDFYSRYDSYQTQYIYDNNIKAIISSNVNTGYVYNTSFSSSRITVSVDGGRTYYGSEYETRTQSPYTSSAYSDTYCTRYSCPSGGTADRYGYCQGRRGSTYELRGNNYTVTCSCNSGRYSCNDPGTYTPCEQGYYRKGNSAYGCTPSNPTGSCTSGTSFSKHCYATCYWDEYKGTCASTATEYYCDRGEELIGRTCYSCSRGYLNRNNRCEYDVLVDYAYWEYRATITYIVSP